MKFLKKFFSEEKPHKKSNDDIKPIVDRIYEEYIGIEGIKFEKVDYTENYVEVIYVMAYNNESIKNNFCRRISNIQQDTNSKITLTADYIHSPFTNKIRYGLRLFR